MMWWLIENNLNVLVNLVVVLDVVETLARVGKGVQNAIAVVENGLNFAGHTSQVRRR